MISDTPSNAPMRQPAEWQPHEACWVAWPAPDELWPRGADVVRATFARLCAAIADVDPAGGAARGERVDLLVTDGDAEAVARAALGDTPVRFHHMPYGDVWLRDTGCVFVAGAARIEAVCFRWNGWGGKFLYEHDDGVARRIAAITGAGVRDVPLVFEGGSIDVDGEGSCLTTRQCLLNPNRNGAIEPAVVERHLRDALGVESVLWLGDGLLEDHTDGHVDNLARFVRPGVVACMVGDAGDPNRHIYRAAIDAIEAWRDARGRALEVAPLPSPGAVVDDSGKLMPASYVNFYIANTTVVVPTFGVAADDRALDAVQALFPGRRVVGIDARPVLAEGGAFHCMTQQQPVPPGAPDA